MFIHMSAHRSHTSTHMDFATRFMGANRPTIGYTSGRTYGHVTPHLEARYANGNILQVAHVRAHRGHIQSRCVYLTPTYEYF